MKKNPSLTRQVQFALNNKLRIGESKHTDKIAGVADQYIYSWDTYKTYLKHCVYFTDFCKKEFGCRTLDECEAHVVDFMRSRAELSPYTQKMELSALNKLYDKKFDIPLPKRERGAIKRSRGDAIRDRNFSEENNREVITFCKCSGLRRAELSALKVEDIVFHENDIYISVNRATKGGRERLIQMYGADEELQIVKSVIHGKDLTAKVFDKVNTNLDIHSYRAIYCRRVYNTFKRDLSDLPKEEVYKCRKDKKGVVYDKKAMLKASQALGHNRISIIAEHYLEER